MTSTKTDLEKGQALIEEAWSRYSALKKPGREDFKTLMEELGQGERFLAAPAPEAPQERLLALIRLHTITLNAKFYEGDAKTERTRCLSPKAKKHHRELIDQYRRELGQKPQGLWSRLFGSPEDQ